MNTALRDVLHDAIERDCVAAGPPLQPPGSLLEQVLGRYRRRRRITTALAVVVVLLAAAVTVPVALSFREDRGPTVAAWAGQRWVLTAMGPFPVGPRSNPGGPESWEALLLNKQTGQYDRVPYLTVVPSPDGRWAVVSNRPYEIGVLDRATGQVRTINRAPEDRSMVDGISWAPDSSRFVITEWPRAAFDVQSARALIVDPASLSVDVVEVPENALPLGGSYVWAPTGDRLVAVAATVTGQTVDHDNVDEFDLSGRHLRRIPTGGPVTGNTQYSPDGRRIALPEDLGEIGVTPAQEASPPQVRIVDASSGAALGSVVLPAGTQALLAWYDEAHLVVAVDEARRPDPPAGNAPDVPDLIKLKIIEVATGAVVHTIDVSNEGNPWYLRVTPATGLSKEAMKLAF